MEKKLKLILMISIITSASCQFEQSVNKDLTTGAYSRGDGIGCDDVAIEINGEVENRNEFVYGEKVNFIFNNISGLVRLDNKTYPGLSMHIVRNDKDTVLSNLNLLKNLNDGTDLFPLQLHANFISALPYQNNEDYKAYVKIWDKKGDGKFNYELPFTVKENGLLDIKNNGIKYSNIYLWNNTLKKPVFNNSLNLKHKFILILDDIEGLELINNKVFPVFSLDLIDNEGNKVLSNPNLLEAYEEEGVSPDNLKSQLTAEIVFKKGQINNPYILNAKLKDKNSSKEISLITELVIN